MHGINNVKFIRIRFSFVILGPTTEVLIFFVWYILKRKEKMETWNISVELNFVTFK
jgi:hypothetical protein